MAAEELPPLRIGHAERKAAQEALDEHLAAGRLGIEEYADRSAAATNAMVAADLAALFTDLPEPHPELPSVRPPSTGGLAANGWSLMGIAVIAAIGLLLLTRQPAVFLLIPLAAGFLWFSRR